MPTIVHLIRHGQSTFNVHNDITGEDPLHFDAGLSPLGQQQVAEARDAFAGQTYDLVIASPLTRALQTALGLFDGRAPIIVDAGHREWQNWSCDIGRSPGDLARDFPMLDFTRLPDPWWIVDGSRNGHGIVCEPETALLDRVTAFKRMIATRREERIAVIGHGDFFYRLIGRQLKNCELVEWAA